MMDRRLARLQHVHERVTAAEDLRLTGQLAEAAAALGPLAEQHADCWGVIYTLVLVR